jgi:hypothetical protein
LKHILYKMKQGRGASCGLVSYGRATWPNQQPTVVLRGRPTHNKVLISLEQMARCPLVLIAR